MSTPSYFENLLKINMSYSGERNTAENVFFAACTAAHGASLADLATLAGDIYTEWVSQLASLTTNGITFAACSVADWTSAEGLTGVHDGSSVGTLTGDLLPSQVAVLCNYDTNLRYRGGRGRMYLPQPTGAQLENDQNWTSTYIGDVEAAMATLLSFVNEQTLASAGMNWVLYHRGTTNVPQGFEDVLAITVNPIPGTQRRRVRRVGHKR